MLVVQRGALVALAAAIVILPLPALAQSAPRLAAFTIDVWPEYDRPATVLIIYRGQFAPDAPLPAQVRLRIPASAGEPSAVAAPQPGGETAPVNQWTDLTAVKQVTVTRSGDWIEVAFAPPSRLFNLEFYDKLNTVTFDRRYAVTWPGDLAADTVVVNVREPFGAVSFQSTPALPPGVRDDEGLVAHQLNVGALAVNQPLALSLSYRREDRRTSVEALQLATPVPTRPPVSSTPAGTSSWLLIGALVIGLALVVGGILWYARSRRADVFQPYEPPGFRRSKGRRSVRTLGPPRGRPRPSPRPFAQTQDTPSRLTVASTPSKDQETAGFCTQCGKPLRPDDVFCSQCGARVKGK